MSTSVSSMRAIEICVQALCTGEFHEIIRRSELLKKFRGAPVVGCARVIRRGGASIHRAGRSRRRLEARFSVLILLMGVGDIREAVEVSCCVSLTRNVQS
jgi:hypothetical protein